MAKIAAFAVIVMAASVSLAQNRMMTGSVAHAPVVHAPAPARGVGRTTVRIAGRGGFDRGFHARRFGRSGFYGYGYGWPYGYSDYDGYEEEPVVQQPPTAAPAPTVQFREEPVASPALLELQGDQWVKVNSFATGAVFPKSPSGQVAGAEMAPAILIYRDGHREEVSTYSIIGDTIYTKADYYASGSWERKIQIADLDVPATLKQNRDRGVKFELPSGPNEVVLRP
jgi:hypothetical protein